MSTQAGTTLIPAPTPVMSKHARERCAEMGISTKVAKRIWRRPTLMTYPGNPGSGATVAVSREWPEYMVVGVERDDEPDLIVSIMFRSPKVYVRNGTTFEVIEDAQ